MTIPIPKFLDKRTWDDRLFDVDCTDLLDVDERIVQNDGQPISIKADPQQPVNGEFNTGLSFGGASINPAPIYYPKLDRWAPIGKALQFVIAGGCIPQGATELFCIVRVRFSTTASRQLEATQLLRLIDTP